MRTKFGYPCVSETDGHGSDWFTGRDYRGYDDVIPEPTTCGWPRGASHLIRKHKRCRVTTEFDALFPLSEGENDQY